VRGEGIIWLVGGVGMPTC